MKKLKLLIQILRSTGLDKIVIIFILFVFFSALVITYAEPEIISYEDGLWYCLSVFTTLGIGDFVTVTTVGRIFSAILVIYGIIIAAVIPGIIISYYQEILRIKSHESIAEFIQKIEDLPNLSKEELTQISQSVKKNRYRL